MGKGGGVRRLTQIETPSAHYVHINSSHVKPLVPVNLDSFFFFYYGISNLQSAKQTIFISSVKCLFQIFHPNMQSQMTTGHFSESSCKVKILKCKRASKMCPKSQLSPQLTRRLQIEGSATLVAGQSWLVTVANFLPYCGHVISWCATNVEACKWLIILQLMWIASSVIVRRTSFKVPDIIPWENINVSVSRHAVTMGMHYQTNLYQVKVFFQLTTWIKRANFGNVRHDSIRGRR